MAFPTHRPRRLRRSEAIRTLVRETRLTPSSLIYPLFVCPGSKVKDEIKSMPGNYRWSVDLLVDECRAAYDLGIPAVILFGIPETKDEVGSGAYDPEGIVQRAVRALKKAVPDLLVICDLCLCEYTSHGHCGAVKNGEIDNDSTLDLLAKTALAQARAGADMVAPSDMMDGRVGRIRAALDAQSFTQIPIHGLFRQVRLGVLRALPRGRRFYTPVWRPPIAPDGSRQPARGAARNRLGH